MESVSGHPPHLFGSQLALTMPRASSAERATPSVKPWVGSRLDASPSWSIYCGDARTLLLDFPPKSVDCMVTSPPYFWQRDYGVEGQIGMEAEIDGFVDNIVQAMRGVWHVLKPTGVAFLNLGDSYYNAKGRPHGSDPKHAARMLARRQLRAVDGPGLGLPRKSLIGIPWRAALALQADGWTLRSDLIWFRRTAMPEPTSKDRPWRQHEHIFMLVKDVRYHFERAGLGGEEDVWEIEPERNNGARGQHYAPYPKALVRRCLAVGCRTGGTVLDPFAGGGTTLEVAREMGIHSIGVDLNPDFCDVMASRLARAPGNEVPAVIDSA